MDDLFDSLIYIIITLAAFAISLLGKKKKKDTRRVPTLHQEEEPSREKKPFLSNLEQLLNEELGVGNQNYSNQFEEEAQFIQKPEKVEIKEEPLDSVPPELLGDKEDVPYSVEYSESSDLSSKQVSAIDVPDEEEESVAGDFNLEDAIIYSEILNRKEY